MVAAVLGGATESRVRKSGVHLFGRLYVVEAFEESRPDAFCNQCSRWGHIPPHCSADPRCSICAKGHTTHDNQCFVEGSKAGRGHGCTHVATQCAKCKGPHGARADAWGWRSPTSGEGGLGPRDTRGRDPGRPAAAGVGGVSGDGGRDGGGVHSRGYGGVGKEWRTPNVFGQKNISLPFLCFVFLLFQAVLGRRRR